MLITNTNYMQSGRRYFNGSVLYKGMTTIKFGDTLLTYIARYLLIAENGPLDAVFMIHRGIKNTIIECDLNLKPISITYNITSTIRLYVAFQSALIREWKTGGKLTLYLQLPLVVRQSVDIGLAYGLPCEFLVYGAADTTFCRCIIPDF